MKVPVRRQPDTRVSNRQLAYSRPGPALDFSPIAESIDGLRAQLADEQRQRQKFDINKRFMQEVNELQADFERRKRDPTISPYTFADTTDQAYIARHEQLLNNLYDEGFDRDLIEEHALRLGTLRQGFFENGLGHQLGTLRSRALAEVDEFGVNLSQYVAANPDGYASSIEELRESINSMPDLTEQEKIAKFDEQAAIIRNGGGKGLAMTNHGLVIELLDPNGLTAAVTVSSATGSAYSIISGLDADRSAVASTLAGTMPPQVVAGFLGNFDTEGGYGGALGDNGTASGIAQWRLDRRDNFRRMFGKEPHQATKAEQAQFVVWEMNNPAEANMTVAQRDAILNARTPEEAAELIDMYYERSSGEHRQQRRENAARYGMLATVDPGASTAEQAPPLEGTTEPPQTIADAKTGNALLDDMNGPERLQVLAWAREQNNRQTAQAKAAMDVAIANAVASVSTGEYSGPMLTEEQVIAVYGSIEGPQKWAEFEGLIQTGQVVQRIRSMHPTDIDRELARLEPDPTSEAYNVQVKLYEAAQRAKASVLAQRDEDPAAYAMSVFPEVAQAAERGEADYYAALDRAYERLGIDKRYAAPLPEQAMERAAQDYKVMTPVQRRQYIQRNFSSMGEDRFRQFVQGMKGTTAADDARIYALMRNYRGASGEWEGVYQSVLEGREMISQDPAKRPNAQMIRENFRLQAFEAINNLNPAASRAIQEAAVALYVFNGGHPTQFDASLYKESLQTALGGSPPWNDTKGRVEDYTILPSNVTAQQFEGWRDGLQAGDLTRLSVERTPPLYDDLRTQVLLEDIIDEGVFVMTSPGRYMIKMASDGKPLMTRSGRPFLVNIDSRTVR